MFANKVNNGIYGFNTAYYQLAADVTVTTMAGTENHKFMGHFDGGIYDENHQLTGHHTLTLSYGSAASPISEDYCAPFRYIEDAEFSNLTVDGTIYTKNMFAAGLAGYALNNNTITDCRCSVTINSSVNGDGTHGGFVANCQNNDDGETYVTFTRCAFDGQLVGANTDNWGGFVGWTEGNDWANVKTVGCLFTPAEVNVDSDGCATFSRGRDNNWSHITNEYSYYTQSLGTIQGNMAYFTPPTNVTSEAKTIAGITVYVRNTVVTDVTATDITPTKATISWKGTDACSNYQVRYREKKNSDIYSTSFEDGVPDGWTTFDNEDDEHNWTYEDGTKKGMAHSGSSCMYSASYINNYGSLEPDNWLVSPQFDLRGTMKVWLKGQDGDAYREHFAIYLTTSETGSKSDFLDADGKLLSTVITLVPETETTSEYQEYTADLSAYSGQAGYIAIRHFNCYDEFYLVLDDFIIYDDNLSDEWATVPGASASGAGGWGNNSPSGAGGSSTITGLNPITTYEYQVGYDYGGNTFYTSTSTLTTLADDVAPTGLSATAITSNAATIRWTGFGDSYNLRYYKGGLAMVTLSVPDDIWDDGSGYQMLLDKDHNTYGSVIPESGGLTISGDAPDGLYDYFEYKIPINADGDLDTKSIVDGDKTKEVTITVVAGIYDWCITNPSPGDRLWIASENGNVGGRQNDFTFEAGKHYTFTVTLDYNIGNDCVNMTVEDEASLTPGDVIEINDITATSYNMSSLTASTNYTVYVQSVKGEGEDKKTSEWSGVNFTTLDEGELYLYDDQDNSTVLANSVGQTFNVTLRDRTLYKDGAWNTLCLPFALIDGDIAPGYPSSNGGIDGTTFTGTLLEGAEVMGFDHASFDATTGTLEIIFVKDYEVRAGEPFLVRWTKADPSDPDLDDLIDPVFNSVTISAEEPQTCDPEGYDAAFIGTYGPVNIYTDTKTNLYLGADNTLYYPWAEGMNSFNINACRAYFHLNNGLTAGEPTSQSQSGIRAFVLNFGEEETQGIMDNKRETINNKHDADAWYTLSGVKVSVSSVGGDLQSPTPSVLRKGLYIHNGRKVVIK